MVFAVGPGISQEIQAIGIWTPGQEAGWELLQGKLETELAKKGTVPVQVASVLGH